jgi:hypothetical protein
VDEIGRQARREAETVSMPPDFAAIYRVNF